MIDRREARSHPHFLQAGSSWRVAEPASGLADAFWLTAHDSPGFKVRLSARILGVALAAGLVSELLLANHVSLRVYGRLRLERLHSPSDPGLKRVVQEIDAEASGRARRPLREQGPPGQDLGEWLTFLAVDDLAYGLVADRLAAAGAVVRESHRNLLGRRVSRRVPRDSTVSGRPANRIAMSLEYDGSPGGRQVGALSKPDLIIAALYVSTGLDGHALAIVDQHGRAELARQIGSVLPVTVRELLHIADALIGSATMIGHR